MSTAHKLRVLQCGQSVTLALLALALCRAQPGRAAALAMALLAVAPLALVGTQMLQRQRWAPRARGCAAVVLREAWLQARTFGWLQPWRSRTWPDDVHGRRRGVVLVHGYWCNRGVWNPLLRRLDRRGTPFVAPDLEPMPADIEAYAARIDAAVRQLHAAGGGAPVIVAHSMGGLAVRAWLAARPVPPPVARIVFVGTPHQGTPLARWARSPAARQMRPHSAWLRALAQREPALPPALCIAATCDQVVYPPTAALLRGVPAHLLDGTGHLGLITAPATWRAVLRALRD